MIKYNFKYGVAQEILDFIDAHLEGVTQDEWYEFEDLLLEMCYDASCVNWYNNRLHKEYPTLYPVAPEVDHDKRLISGHHIPVAELVRRRRRAESDMQAYADQNLVQQNVQNSRYTVDV